MKNSIEKFSNDIYRVKANQQLTNDEPGFCLAGYSKNEPKSFTGSLHAFIVDWQIPETEKLIKV